VKTSALVATLLVAGCASNAELANESASRAERDVATLNAAACCTPTSSIDYVPIASGRSSLIEIGPRSPVIALSSGRSYAAGFLVPPRPSKTYLTVRSFGVGIWAPTSLNFYPSFLFFDDRGVPLISTIQWTIRPVRADWVDRANLEALIELPPSSTPTRVLVYTKPEDVNKRTPLVVDAGVHMVPNGVHGSVRAILP
jgi:hypothetical protein